MKVCIHRGTQQIGGTCIELESQGRRIALDVGLPLDADEVEDHASLLPPVRGFREPVDSLLGIVISHPHQDHYGLARFVRSEVPVLIGEAAHRILQAASPFVPNGIVFAEPTFISNETPLELGPFTITPFLVDHSAFDAYALLIEANGKRLFYSGDFRGHGRKARLFEKLVAHPPGAVDALLMEGTTIGSNADAHASVPEAHLVDDFARIMRETTGMCLVWGSAQNIDRMVTIQKAANLTGRQLILDFYTAEILRATGNDAIIGGIVDQARIFLPGWQWQRIKDNHLTKRMDPYWARRIKSEALQEAASKSVLLYRPSMQRELERANCLQGAGLVYSLWNGYLDMEPGRTQMARLKELGISSRRIHTSGHASVGDLQRLAKAINAKTLVPIHSFEPDRYQELFDRVEQKQDGEWWGGVKHLMGENNEYFRHASKKWKGF